ncbi:MAG: sigma-54 dependent transcriptional regulator [Chromatiaceae bacterium]|nr:sigma-54 dependent transcriptional regulator [Candidatus Thioaporhodococcus sediminis]
MIGKSASFLKITALVAKIADCDAPVLLEGETGTGKELVARAIHYQGKRRDQPFVPVNCGAIPDLLIENELFGHRKGAFTDARGDQPGLIAHAHSGTLFLDEVEALTPKGQVTLLRFLQDQHYRPLGDTREHATDVRIVAASNASLTQLAEAGQFRMDLLYRLKILFLELPPLREREGDPVLLAEHFMRVCSERFGKPLKTFHPDTLKWIASYPWPGNIRELENWVYREFFLADGPVIQVGPVDRLPADRRKRVDRRQLMIDGLVYATAKAKALEDFETKFLASVLAKAEGNVTAAATLAGTERRYLGKLLKKRGLDKNHYLS